MLIAQISDLHVCAEGVLYKGVADSNAMLIKAIDHIHQLDKRPDLVLITGDLVADGLVEEYEVAVQLLSRLKIPYLVIPGNHDIHQHFRAAFASHLYLPSTKPFHYVVDNYPVRIVAIDCCLDGTHSGSIDEVGLKWLKQTLNSNHDKPTLIIAHHPPFISGISYLDEYRFLQTDELAHIIKSAPNIEAVLVGHVHRSMVHRWAGTVVLACPSTTTEIALRLDANAQPQSYVGPGAYLLHLWSEKQGLVSHLCHVDEQNGPHNFF